jgi:hypothetical protein
MDQLDNFANQQQWKIVPWGTNQTILPIHNMN